MSPRASAIFLTVTGAIVGAMVAPAHARISVIYDEHGASSLLTAQQPDGQPGVSPADGFLQQSPAKPVLPVEAQALKVHVFGGTADTPSIRGLPSGAIARLLLGRVDASPSGTVFIEEFVGGMGPDLARRIGAAFELLTAQPHPGGGTYADRVHVYVSGLPQYMLREPERWSGAWQAMSLAGGVWLETFSRERRPWTSAEWLTVPRAMTEMLLRHGGSVDRIHLLLTEAPQDKQWTMARTGAACQLLANGPGAYRVHATAPAWVSEFRATFGRVPATPGPASVACHPTPRLTGKPMKRLVRAMRMADPGPMPTQLEQAPRQLAIGGRARVAVSASTLMRRTARLLDMTPRQVQRIARPRIVLSGTGFDQWIPLRRGKWTTTQVPIPKDGVVAARLELDGPRLVRALAKKPVDVLASIDAAGGAPTTRRAVALQPNRWTISVPLAPLRTAALPQARPPRPAVFRQRERTLPDNKRGLSAAVLVGEL